MGKTKKIYRVKFTETNAYYIDIKAEDEDRANEIAQERYWSLGPLPRAGFELDSAWRGDGIEFTETDQLPPRTPDPHSPIIPVCRSHNAYTYSPEHCHGKGWVLANESKDPGTYLTIEKVDAAAAYASDMEAAFHVICAATFDTGPEGNACRDALRTITAFGHDGLNPIATMLPIRRKS